MFKCWNGWWSLQNIWHILQNHMSSTTRRRRFEKFPKICISCLKHSEFDIFSWYFLIILWADKRLQYEAGWRYQCLGECHSQTTQTLHLINKCRYQRLVIRTCPATVSHIMHKHAGRPPRPRGETETQSDWRVTARPDVPLPPARGWLYLWGNKDSQGYTPYTVVSSTTLDCLALVRQSLIVVWL